MIRPAREGDMPRILEIYAAARAFMKTSGNPTQLTDRYPWKRICGRISACSACMWWWRRPSAPASCWLRGPMTPTPIFLTGRGDQAGEYGVLHRVASDGTKKGIVSLAVAFAARRFSYLRIDTHEDNLPMQRALAREGFVHRGTILAHNGTPRLAYNR